MKELAYVTLALGGVPWGPLFLTWGLGGSLILLAAAVLWAGCWYIWLWLKVTRAAE